MEITIDRKILRDLIDLIDDTNCNTDGRYPLPDSGCIHCTAGTVLDKFNTGACSYHKALKILDDTWRPVYPKERLR